MSLALDADQRAKAAAAAISCVLDGRRWRSLQNASAQTVAPSRARQSKRSQLCRRRLQLLPVLYGQHCTEASMGVCIPADYLQASRLLQRERCPSVCLSVADVHYTNTVQDKPLMCIEAGNYFKTCAVAPFRVEKYNTYCLPTDIP